MAPRTILYTGKGGVGKTSVAAATARRCAAAGLRTVVLSTDPAHSLSDSFEAELASAPVQCGDNLWGQEVQAQEEMERHWDAVQDWMGEMLVERGVDRIAADELTVPPGMDELFSLLQIKRHHVDPAGHEPGSDGDPRGDAHLHVPQPVRVPDRRRRGEPGVPGGGGRRVLRRLASSPAGADGAGAIGVRPGAHPHRALLRRGG